MGAGPISSEEQHRGNDTGRSGAGEPKFIAGRRCITIPNDADVDTPKSAFEDVAVSYKYIPDDPIERACWKQWRSLPSEEAVRLTSGPAGVENFKMFFAKCRAEASTK